jgi:3-hydroxybutyryl-CoA dehydrogenase
MAAPELAGSPVLVVGAGTMGAGIAQVAAQAGHPVLLFDAREGAAQQAVPRLAAALQALVAKGRLAADAAQAALGRIAPIASLGAARDATLVVEAIVEDLDAKRSLFRDLEGIVASSAALASNTSSISITALANGLVHPRRLAGMHFFNPVPAMKLVEVVTGAETDPAVAQALFALAQAWGKTPVHAKSTPGFIVNRIARPYYAEALALLQEQAAAPAAIDALARGQGFRMGPCELMDLIGHDVNYAVTCSVFEANHGDRRYVPSLVQKALIDGGRLGRKVGRGFYDGPPAAGPLRVGPAASPGPLRLHGSGTLVEALAAALGQRGLGVARDVASAWNGIASEAVELHLCDGRTAARLAAERNCRELAVIDVPPPGDAAAIGVAYAPGAGAAVRAAVTATLCACGWQPVELRDVPGLWAARTLAMLVNEGADAVWQGVCDEGGAELAMRLGVNWPAGPFAWLARLGLEQVVAVLDHLFEATRGERYRVSPLLAQRLWAARIGAAPAGAIAG